MNTKYTPGEVMLAAAIMQLMSDEKKHPSVVIETAKKMAENIWFALRRDES